MMEKTLILKHISEMLCLLISYSKFTRPNPPPYLNPFQLYDIISAQQTERRDSHGKTQPSPAPCKASTPRQLHGVSMVAETGWLCCLITNCKEEAPCEIHQRKVSSPWRAGKRVAALYPGWVSLHTHRPDAAKMLGRKIRLPAGIAAAKLPDSSGTSARRLAGTPGRAVLSVYPCHPENHLPKITDGDRDKAVPVFFIQIGSARFGR